MTKLHGWETLFHGTAVVYAPAEPSGSQRGFHWSVEEIACILLISFMLLYFWFGSTLMI